MSAVTIARATMDAQAREKASMSAVARDVGRGQERLAAFRVARPQGFLVAQSRSIWIGSESDGKSVQPVLIRQGDSRGRGSGRQAR